ncbi:Hypothetical predicted protein [Cloeon dipterum]|uniref:Uncharacterized protein n=1 Tax=Cloeon dipterum TaxID=197152 RepID=A0A8S1CZ35_9INSE|nr:Hypothetical predicted protein [Cloeon dipterum]
MLSSCWRTDQSTKNESGAHSRIIDLQRTKTPARIREGIAAAAAVTQFAPSKGRIHYLTGRSPAAPLRACCPDAKLESTGCA